MSNTTRRSRPRGTPERLAVALAGLALIFSPWVWTARAQSADNALGVQEAVDLSEQNNPHLNAMRERIEGHRSSRTAALGLSSPLVTYAREGIASGEAGFAEQRWVFSQPLPSLLQSYYGVRRIDAEVDALEYRYESLRRMIKAQVKADYTRLLYAQEIVHLREQEVELARTLMEAVQTRVEVGESSELDLMKAELQAAEALSNLESATRTFQNQRYALFNTIGLDPEEQQYSIRFPDTLRYQEVEIDQGRLLSHIEDQPQLSGADRAVDSARLGVKEQRSAALPDLTFSYWPQDFGEGYEFSGFEVGVRVPLWGLLSNRGAVRQARAREREREWERQAVFLDLKKQVEQTWHSYETTLQTIERYTREVRGRASELLALTREGYQLGELDLLTLLDTQRTYVASQIRYYDALRDYYLDLIELERYLEQDLVFASAP